MSYSSSSSYGAAIAAVAGRRGAFEIVDSCVHVRGKRQDPRDEESNKSPLDASNGRRDVRPRARESCRNI